MKKIVCIIIAIILLAILPAGCSSFYNDREARLSSFLKESKVDTTISDDISVDGLELDELEIVNGVGEIRVSKGAGKNIEVHYDKRIKYISGDAEKVSDTILVDTKVKGSKLIVEVRSADSKIQDLWQWLSEKFRGINVSVDLDIKVPENVRVFEVNNGVGDINIADIKGSIKVNSGVGDVSLSDVTLYDDCTINNGTGDIYIDASADDLSKLRALAGVGDVRIVLPEDTKLSIKADTGVGNIEGSLIDRIDKEGFVSDSLKQDINGGGPVAKIDTGTGNIRIDKR